MGPEERICYRIKGAVDLGCWHVDNKTNRQGFIACTATL